MYDTNPTVKEILRTLFKNAHGKAAESIDKYQGKELPSFGIMYPDIRSLADQYQNDNEIAKALIIKNTREARIIALLEVDVPNADLHLLSLLFDHCQTEELKNQLARHVIAPYARIHGWKELMTLLDDRMALKSFIQFFRAYKSLPDYSLVVNRLNSWVTNQLTPEMDAAHLAEAIFRYFTNQRKEFRQELEKLKRENPGYSKAIEEWIKDFQYIDDF